MKLSQKRAKLTKRILTYRKRRESYRKSISIISKYIKRDLREIRRVDIRASEIRQLGIVVTHFTNINVRYKKYNRDDENVKIAKGFFFKYGTENGMRASELIGYIGMSRPYLATEYRKWVTKRITIDDKVKQKWENFKEYMKNN